jgi:energy-coupling factor transport system permease protein
MLKNITLGQFYPSESLVHRLDPRVKIILTISLIAGVFLAKTFVGYGIILAYLMICAALSTVPVRMLARGLKPLRFIIILTFLLNLFFSQGETEWFTVWFITVTREGFTHAIHYSLRLVFLVLATSIMTLTTSPIALSDGIELLLSPLKVIRFPAHELAMMMTIALRFIPSLLEETDKIMKAQMARGADFESGNLLTRARAMVPLLVPLFVSAFRRAADLAMAMEARCYHGGKGRTRLRVLKISRHDLYACLSAVILLGLIILERTVL